MNGSQCKDTKDCKNGSVCTMTYADENKSTPLGRFCKGGREPDDKIVSCKVSSDCPEGECEVVRDRRNRFIGRQCTRIDGSAVKESDLNRRDLDPKDYPHQNPNEMLRLDKKIEASDGGPVARMIAEIITLVFAVVDQAFFIGRNIFYGIFWSFGKIFLGGKGDLSVLMLDTITEREYPNDNPEELKKCKKDKSCPTCYSLWLIRNIFTLLIPPYGVMMTHGIWGVESLRKIAISCILTAFFYFPGLIYSLIIVNSNKLVDEERKLTKCKNQRKVIKNSYSIEKLKKLSESIRDPHTTTTDLFK